MGGMREEELARRFLGKPPRVDRRREGMVLGGVGLAVFLGSAVLLVLLPVAASAAVLAVMGLAVILLAAGYLRMR